MFTLIFIEVALRTSSEDFQKKSFYTITFRCWTSALAPSLEVVLLSGPSLEHTNGWTLFRALVYSHFSPLSNRRGNSLLGTSIIISNEISLKKTDGQLDSWKTLQCLFYDRSDDCPHTSLLRTGAVKVVDTTELYSSVNTYSKHDVLGKHLKLKNFQLKFHHILAL